MATDNSIKIYRYGTANTQGNMKCVVFYDKISSGVLSTVNSNDLNFLDFSTETNRSIVDSNTTVICNRADIENNSYLWLAGGIKDRDYSTLSQDCHKIQKQVKIQTAVYQSQLNMVRGTPNGISGVEYGYILGGQIIPESPTYTPTIEKFNYNATTITLLTGEMSYSLEGAGVFSNTQKNYIYIAGGRTSGDELSTILRFYTASESTNTVSRANLAQKVKSPAVAYNTVYGYIAGGNYSSESSWYTNIQKYNISSDTVNAVSNSSLALPVLTGSNSTYDNNNWYFLGGNNAAQYQQKYNLSNDTVSTSVINYINKTYTGVTGQITMTGKI